VKRDTSGLVGKGNRKNKGGKNFQGEGGAPAQGRGKRGPGPSWKKRKLHKGGERKLPGGRFSGRKKGGSAQEERVKQATIVG